MDKLFDIDPDKDRLAVLVSGRVSDRLLETVGDEVLERESEIDVDCVTVIV